MAASFLGSSPNPFPRRCTTRKRASRPAAATTTLRTFAMRSWDQDFGRSNNDKNMVDENMIVLRKRIHEMKMIERNYEPPSDWMDWEKSYYTSYDSTICDAVGILQLMLMNTRPSLAIGIVALVSLSVPTSLFFLISQLLGLIDGVLSAGIH